MKEAVGWVLCGMNVVLALGLTWALLRLRKGTALFYAERAEREQLQKDFNVARADFQREELWWHSLIQEVPAAVYVLDREGRIKSMTRLFAGRLPVDLLGCRLADMLDVHEQEVFGNVLKKVFEQGVSTSYNSRMVTPQGGSVWYENCIGPVDGDGDIREAICIAFDVTQRKIAQDHLQEMSLAVEYSPVAIAITDRFGKIEYVNLRFSTSTGYRLEELYGQPLRILRDGDLPEEARGQLRAAVGKGMQWSGECLERRKDGVEFWEFVTVSPIINEDGDVSHLIVLKEDITERRRAREQREADLNFLKDLLDAIPSPVFYKDHEGIYRGCNRAFEEYAGKPRGEILGRTAYDVLAPEIAQQFCEADVQGLREGDRYVHEANVRYADGKWRDVRCFKSVLRRPDGVMSGLVGVMLDVTDHKRMEEELRSNETQLMTALEEVKMFNMHLEQAQDQLVQQEKLAAIGFLAAGVAHEINNPLGFVNGNLMTLGEYAAALLEMMALLEALSDAVEAGDMAAVAAVRARVVHKREAVGMDYIVKDLGNLLAETQQGVERIRKIVQGVKNFSRGDGGEMSVTSVNDILESVSGIVLNEVKYRAELVKDYGQVPLIHCNVQQLSQVFVNLLVNAGQAIVDKGVITVRTYTRANEVVVEIGDTGTGIPDEIRSKIFDPFFTTKEPGQGTGLGLSISYDIIRKHGGRIELQSQVGVGSTFTVIFPVKAA